MLTANEWEGALTRQDYVLYHVIDLTSPPTTRMRVYRDLGRRLTPDLVDAAGWAVTGWRELEPDEITVHEDRMQE